MNFENYDDEHLIFGLLLILGNQLQVIGDKFYDEITAKQWIVMLMIEAFGENYPTMNELSEMVGSSHQNVKQIAIKLERKGYVEIFSDDLDKRKCRIKNTKKCEEINIKYQNKQMEFMNLLFKDIEPDTLRHAAKALVKLEENMEMMK